MRLFLRVGALLAAGALGVGCSEQSSSAEAVTPPPGKTDKQSYSAAASALIAILGQPGARSSLPNSEDPAVAAYLNEVRAMTVLLGTNSMPATSMEEYEALCGTASTVMTTYVTAGVNERISKNMSEAEFLAALQKRQQENIPKYWGVIFPLTLYSQHCTAVFAPLAEAYISNIRAGDPAEKIRIDGARNFGANTHDLVRGMLLTLVDPGLTQKGRDIMMSQFEKDWDGLILVMSPEQRVATTQQLSQAVPLLSTELGTRIKVLAARTSAAKCGTICSL